MEDQKFVILSCMPRSRLVWDIEDTISNPTTRQKRKKKIKKEEKLTLTPVKSSWSWMYVGMTSTQTAGSSYTAVKTSGPHQQGSLESSTKVHKRVQKQRLRERLRNAQA